jgi:hypothetical protein
MDRRIVASRYILQSFRKPCGGVYVRGMPWKLLDDGVAVTVVRKAFSPAWKVAAAAPAIALVLGLVLWWSSSISELSVSPGTIVRWAIELTLPVCLVAMIYMGAVRTDRSSARVGTGSQPLIIVQREHRIVGLPAHGVVLRHTGIAAFQLLEGDFGPRGQNIAELNIITADQPPARYNILCNLSGRVLQPVADALAAAAGVPLHIYRRDSFGTSEHMLEPFDMTAARERASHSNQPWSG